MTLTLEGLNLKNFQKVEDLYDGPWHNWSIYGELTKIQPFKFMEFNYIFFGKNSSCEIIYYSESLLLKWSKSQWPIFVS